MTGGKEEEVRRTAVQKGRKRGKDVKAGGYSRASTATEIAPKKRAAGDYYHCGTIIIFFLLSFHPTRGILEMKRNEIKLNDKHFTKF